MSRLLTRTALGGQAIVTVERQPGSVRLMLNTFRTDGDTPILNLTRSEAAGLASLLNPKTTADASEGSDAARENDSLRSRVAELEALLSAASTRKAS